ncbi:MAG: SAM-dependent methyltransferase [Alphaproteobacteria bacterium]|nr:SAM-dependent methyltransferase [Alphaproteobacteria bacterium]
MTSAFAKELAQHISDNGPITVADYMSACLQHYYATVPAIGTAGDFTTAPEISQMFGEMLGAWLVDIWMQSGRPDNAQYVELGPGRGTLAADVLRVFAGAGLKPPVHLVETSPEMRRLQKEKLQGHDVTWHDTFDTVPAGFSLIAANEFFDALPVHQYIDDTERRVHWDQGRGFYADPVPKGEKIVESSPVSCAIADTLARHVQNGGAALIIDYGYAAGEKGETLQAVSRHRYASVFDNPGAQDITAHVDFAALARVMSPYAFVLGPVGQGDFLQRLGMTQRAEALTRHANDSQKKDIQTALFRLVAPSEMGQLFKVMGVLPKQNNLNPAGFADAEIQNNRHRQNSTG